jgi:predicted nucleic acid-binding protein
MKGDRVFLDTNIIIYAYTSSGEKKHSIAMNIIEDLWRSGSGVISTQVLQEFFVCVTTKIQKLLNEVNAREIVHDLLKWDVVLNDGESIVKAIDIHQRYHYSFWDALIIQAAIQGNAAVLLSEDLSDGQIIQGVMIKNPFA